MICHNTMLPQKLLQCSMPLRMIFCVSWIEATHCVFLIWGKKLATMLPEFCQVNQSLQRDVTLERFSTQHRRKSYRWKSFRSWPLPVVSICRTTSFECLQRIHLSLRQRRTYATMTSKSCSLSYFEQSSNWYFSMHSLWRYIIIHL